MYKTIYLTTDDLAARGYILHLDEKYTYLPLDVEDGTTVEIRGIDSVLQTGDSADDEIHFGHQLERYTLKMRDSTWRVIAHA